MSKISFVLSRPTMPIVHSKFPGDTVVCLCAYNLAVFGDIQLHADCRLILPPHSTQILQLFGEIQH